MASSLFDTLFKRGEGVDDVSDLPPWRMGISFAASWAWGISIAIGIAIMHSKGLLPFLVWVVPNVLAIPFFGYMRTYLPDMGKWPRWKPFLVFLLFVGAFAIILNMKFINLALGGGTDLEVYTFLSGGLRVPLIIGLSLLIVLYINKTGLRGSVLTDVGQYAVMVLGIGAIVAVGLATGARAEVPWVTVEGGTFWWLRTSAVATLFAILTHGQQWHRMESLGDSERLKGSLYGGLLFGFYMLLVAAAGFVFEGTFLISLLFLIVLLSVATSTIDSAVAAMQWIFQKLGVSPYWGTGLATLSVLSWPLVIDSSVTEFWQFYVNIRLWIVSVLLAITILYTASRSERLHSWFRERGFLLEETPVG